MSQADATESIATLIDRSLADSEILADRLRGSMDILTSRSVAQQLELSEKTFQSVAQQ